MFNPLEHYVKNKLRKLLLAKCKEQNIIAMMNCKGIMSSHQPKGSLGDVCYNPEYWRHRLNVTKGDDIYTLAYLMGCYMFSKNNPSREMYEYIRDNLLSKWEFKIIDGYLKKNLLNEKLYMFTWCPKDEETGFTISSLYLEKE